MKRLSKIFLQKESAMTKETIENEIESMETEKEEVKTSKNRKENIKKKEEEKWTHK